MGYGTRSAWGGEPIKTFSPDETDKRLYIGYRATLEEIIQRAQEKWPGIEVSRICIEAEHIHTDCIGYDRYDPSDYTDFICLSLVE